MRGASSAKTAPDATGEVICEISIAPELKPDQRSLLMPLMGIPPACRTEPVMGGLLCSLNLGGFCAEPPLLLLELDGGSAGTVSRQVGHACPWCGPYRLVLFELECRIVSTVLDKRLLPL